MKFHRHFVIWIGVFWISPLWGGVCGNNVTEPGEACDGTDLGLASQCSDIPGFKSGTLRCQTNCLGLDVSQCVVGSTVTAASCSQADVQSAIAQASNGDTVFVPVGNCTWNSTLNISKGIILKGSGRDSTTINANNVRILDINISGSPFRLTEIGFTGSSDFTMLMVNGNFPNLRIDHCKFTNIMKRSIILGYYDVFQPYPAIKGVIDHNVFISTAGSDFALQYGRDNSWLSPDDPGTVNNLFYEDNDFTWFPPAHVPNDAEHGARFVIRHNSFTNGLLENHDTGSTPNSRGTRWYEIYDNTFHCTSTDCGWYAMDFRGGTGVVFNNVIPIYPNGYENPSASEIYRVGQTGGKPWINQCDSIVDRICSDFRSHCNGGDYRECLGDYDCTGVGDGTCSIDACTQDSQCGSGNTCLEKFDGQLDPYGWPCRDQAGRSQDDPVTHVQGSSPIYWWNNRDTSGNLLKIYIAPADADYIQENREYYNEQERPGYIAYPYPHPLVMLDTPVSNSTSPVPIILVQPQSLAVQVGQQATFQVAASGNPVMTYQWMKNDVTIAGATGTSYTMPAVTLNDNGAQFYCVVSNSYGTVTSSTATLTVITGPVITSDGFLPFKNVFNPSRGEKISVQFGLTQDSAVKLEVYTRRGEKVRTLVEGSLSSGSQSQNWDGKNESGSTVASGVYVLYLTINGQHQTNKVVVK